MWTISGELVDDAAVDVHEWRDSIGMVVGPLAGVEHHAACRCVLLRLPNIHRSHPTDTSSMNINS